MGGSDLNGEVQALREGFAGTVHHNIRPLQPA
jgi:hypothetical protein